MVTNWEDTYSVYEADQETVTYFGYDRWNVF